MSGVVVGGLFPDATPLPGVGEQITDLAQFVEHICEDGDCCPYTRDCMRQVVGPDARCLAAEANVETMEVVR